MENHFKKGDNLLSILEIHSEIIEAIELSK